MAPEVSRAFASTRGLVVDGARRSGTVRAMSPPSAPSRRRHLLALPWVALCGGYVAWATEFVRRTGVRVDGVRYHVAFDDAMISLRYAWNLTHGRGLVWSSGERVEGYSNLLQTLLMALATACLDARRAVVAVQAAGVVWVVASALLAGAVARELSRASRAAALGACAMTLLYYPLSFWSLLGMETALYATLLLGGVWAGLRARRRDDRAPLFTAAALLGVATLARPESLPTAAALLGVALWSRGRPSARDVATTAAIALAPFAAQTVFRLAYYGALTPNTYVLKMTGVPLAERLANGAKYLAHFVIDAWPCLVVAAFGAWRTRRDGGAVVAVAVAAIAAVQVWVGGDAWTYWRHLAPAMPLVFALITHSLDGAFASWGAARPSLAAALGLACALYANAPFWEEWTLQLRPSTVVAGWEGVRVALALRRLTTPDARVGLLWAGTVTYFADRPAVDFLGKCDPHVARLPPDRSGTMARFGMTTLPGHNKYDLRYSIGVQRPVYVQEFCWGTQDASALARDYVDARYRGVTLTLRRDAPEVRWDLVTDVTPAHPRCRLRARAGAAPRGP